jgi:DNA-binding Xre family transcriptional regulator
MARSKKLIKTLKKQLRSQGITYKQVATALALSEASIKNMFAKNHFSLERIDSICELLEIELSDLALLAENDMATISQLSLLHEKELIGDMHLLLVAYCVMNYWTLNEIIKQYEISETECIQHLVKLDKMKMIELQMNNRVRLLISANFSWHTNGPIERFFRQQVQSQFFNADFNSDGELRLVSNGNIGLHSRKRLVERLNSIGEYFEELNQDDRQLSMQERHGTTMVLAIRQWEFEAFKSIEREKT